MEKAQAALFAKGGGVVFFPAGTYRFAHDIKLQSNVILRGAEPEGITSGRDEKFSPLSKLEFPKYVPANAPRVTVSVAAALVTVPPELVADTV